MTNNGKIPTMFIRKLYRMLDCEDPALISWSDMGKTFSVYDCSALEKRILPKYFRGRLTSFRQQLQNHGFIDHSYHNGLFAVECYFHACFCQGEPDQLPLIQNQPQPKIKPSTVRKRTRNTESMLTEISNKKPCLIASKNICNPVVAPVSVYLPQSPPPVLNNLSSNLIFKSLEEEEEDGKLWDLLTQVSGSDFPSVSDAEEDPLLGLLMSTCNDGVPFSCRGAGAA